MIFRLMTTAAVLCLVAGIQAGCVSNACCCPPASSTSSSSPASALSPSGDVPAPMPKTTPASGDAPAMSARYSRPGFAVYEQGGRLWVFEMDSEHHAEFRRVGEPAKSVTKIGVGPEGKTIRSVDTGTIDAYLASWGANSSSARSASGGCGASKYARTGFSVFEEDGRLWVFREGSDALQEFLKSGEPAKSVTRVGAGPDGKTIRSVDSTTIDAYMAR